MRKINEAGCDLIKSYESLKLESYLCPADKWTIGYGHTYGVKKGQAITTLEAEMFLQQDLVCAENAVCDLVQVSLNDNEFSALVSFVFNVGVGNFKLSTLLKLLNKGIYDKVPQELSRWIYCKGEILGGLRRRRAAEAELWDRM